MAQGSTPTKRSIGNILDGILGSIHARREQRPQPPSKLITAVQSSRGGRHPLHISLRAHAEEKTARLRARERRETKYSSGASAPPGPSASPPESPQSAEKKAKDLFLPTRSGATPAVSRILAAHQRDMQRQVYRHEDEGPAKRARVEEGAKAPEAVRRDTKKVPAPLWVRKCSAAKVASLHAGTTKAAELFKAWGEGDVGAATRRRRRRVRRVLIDRHEAVRSRPLHAVAEPVNGGLARSTLSATVRQALHHANSDMWLLVRAIVQERSRTVEKLSQPRTHQSSGAARLSLARMFPTFGMYVDVHTLRVDTALGVVEAAKPSRAGIIVHEGQSFLGVVLLPADTAERTAYIGWLTAPTTADTEQQRVPEVVKVAKMFPGSSGTFADVYPKLVAHHRELQATCCGLPEICIVTVRGRVAHDTATECETFPLDSLRGRCL